MKIKELIHNEKTGGCLLLLCTAVSLIVANTALGGSYLDLWHAQFLGLSIEQWINDALMAVFFLMVGLELVREIKIGEFANPRNVILPIAGAIGGMLIPAAFYFFFNKGTDAQSGIGIPMATDIAFALGILSLLGKRVPLSLKLFLMALAVVDDLGAIIVIALFYTKDLHVLSLLISLGIWCFLLILNRMKVRSLIPYILGGACMWYFMLQSGVHATISGVLLALVLPINNDDKESSPAFRILEKLHIPVTFFILPVFALANTAVVIAFDWSTLFASHITMGIICGLVLGKPIGILLGALVAIKFKAAILPVGVDWKQMAGVSFLGGIGFTMSIFIGLLAFDDITMINTAKIAILISSLIAGLLGYFCLNVVLKDKNGVSPLD